MPPDNHSFFYILYSFRQIASFSSFRSAAKKQKMMCENAYRRRRHFLFFMGVFAASRFGTFGSAFALAAPSGFSITKHNKLCGGLRRPAYVQLRGYYNRTQQGASPVTQARNALALNIPTDMFVLLPMFSSKPKRKLCGGLCRPAYVQLRGYYSIFPSFVKELIMIK